MRAVLGTLLLTVLMTAPTYGQINAIWGGGDGEWNDLNWSDGVDTGLAIDSLVGRTDGSNGLNDDSGVEKNVLLGGGATVNYNANAPTGNGDGSDFRMYQGANFTIAEGASFTHLSDNSWSENRWSEMDLSNLTIDNGSFIRTGVVGAEGGGALIFGSWRGDDAFGRPGALDHQEVTVSLTNGGSLVNEGQLWVGSYDDLAPNGTVISFNINDGHIDLTGGDIAADGDAPANADLMFANKYNINNNPDDQPTYSVNFTGPGSITVDETGILNMFREDSFIDDWDLDSLQPITYEQLWDAGILQAHGRSGPDGATFADFFTTENQLGQADYKLLSMVTPVPGTILGTGTGELLGNDLTDLGDDGDETAYSVDPFDPAGFDAEFFSSDELGFGGGEFAFNVFDNLLGPGNDKWCCGTAFPQIVGADLGRDVELTHFTVSSANDVDARDPRVWSIEGSNDGENWTTIFSQDNPDASLWDERLQVIRFDAGTDFDAPAETYSQFRMVTDATGATEGAFFQLGEIEFFGNVGQVCGDFDMDGDVDSADRTTQTTNWTGALPPGDPNATKTFPEGDCDADGDIDTADQNGLINNWTGAMNAGNLEDGDDANLIYDPADGNVKLDAGDTASGVFISFVLGTGENSMRPENLTESAPGNAGPFVDVGTNTDATTFQIGQTDPLNQGAGPVIDLGNIFPAGIASKEALADYLTLAEYASELGSGGTFDLRVIPEPSSLALALIGMLGLVSRRRRR